MTDTPPAKMVQPPNKIKQKLGPAVNVRDLLKPEAVNKAQATIDSKRDEFLLWAAEDLNALSKHLQDLKSKPLTTELLENIVHCGEHLRDRGGTFGYDLVSQIAKSMVNYCFTIHSPAEHHLIVIEKHIEGLRTVLSEKVEGTGGIIGAELLKGLTSLTVKYT